jgi:predicted amidohydrolase
MSSEGFGVGVAQFAPSADKAANLERIRELTLIAVSRGAAIVVFPEYSSYFSNPIDASFADAAESLDGPFVAELTTIADELDIHIVAGLVEKAGEKFSNTVVAVDGSGVVATYRKLHLYDAFGDKESDWVEPGKLEEPQIFAVRGMSVGLQTCYDIRFPEVTRRLVDAGADLVLVPAEWVRGPLKEHHWRTLVTARALENTIYVAASDHTPPIGVGNSMVVDPMGVEIVTIGEQSDVAVAWVDPARIASTRAINPALALRRFSVVPGAPTTR